MIFFFCLHACLFTMCVQGRRKSEALKLELEMAGKHHVGAGIYASVLRFSARIARTLTRWVLALAPGSVFFIINILKAFFFLLQLSSLCQTILGFALLFGSLISFPQVAWVPPVDCLSWRSLCSALARSSARCVSTWAFGPLHRTHCSAWLIV